jgi:hypothetical protein
MCSSWSFTNLGHQLVAYFQLRLQKVLVQFFIVGTHVLSHMCIFLECHRKNKLTSRVQHLTFTINSKHLHNIKWMTSRRYCSWGQKNLKNLVTTLDAFEMQECVSLFKKKKIQRLSMKVCHRGKISVFPFCFMVIKRGGLNPSEYNDQQLLHSNYCRICNIQCVAILR